MKTIRIILTTVIIANCVGIYFAAHHFLVEQAPQPFAQDEIPTEDSFTEETAVATIELPDLAKEINEKNKELRNLYCGRATVDIGDRYFTFRLAATLAYEGPNKFYMSMRSLFGEQINIGSNDEIFWYWSAMDTERGVHWAKNEDFNKTRLKTPFDPKFLRGSLGFDELTTEGLSFVDVGKTRTLLKYDAKSSTGQPLRKYVHLDTKTKTVFYIDIVDQKGNHVISNIRSIENGLPKEIAYFWQEEKCSMRLTFHRPQKNIKFAQDFWRLPSYSPKINMAD